MIMKPARVLFLFLALILSLSLPAQNRKSLRAKGKTPLQLIGVIAIPGHPMLSTDIAWVDPATKRMYLSDRSNFGIDVVDVENNFFIGRITGFAGPGKATPPPPNGQGPNGVLVTPNQELWAGDGNSTVRVADVNPKSANYLKVIHSINTAIPACASRCDRADEIAYDGTDHLILAVNDQPLAADSTKPGTSGNPYATFISAETYRVLGHVTFPGARGLEQPLWVPELHRFFLSVPGFRGKAGNNGGFGEVAVINPKTRKIERVLKPGECHASGEALGPFHHVLVTCGGPVVIDASNGAILSRITQIGGGDEDWYNPGDGNFYFTANAKVGRLVDSLGVIDARTGTWLENVPDPGGRQAVAFPGNNHIFTPVRASEAAVKDPSRDETLCARFGFRGTGCIAVFAHSGPAR